MFDSDSEVEVHVLDDGLDDTTSTSKQQETPNTFGRSLMKRLGIATGVEATLMLAKVLLNLSNQ